THIMQEVEQLCDDIVVVAHGRSVAHGSAAELRALAGTATLEDAFVALALESDRGSRIADCASTGRVLAEQGASSTAPGRDARGIPG
ncbi:MAG: hypothetical protein HXY24_19015, partial [Rubrivivax sp.]|nr:hypothetical protein [Rubrivivax sp.]